ncbi:MAG: hypothetical protein WA373_13955 [Burkholderiales bacterium]
MVLGHRATLRLGQRKYVFALQAVQLATENPDFIGPLLGLGSRERCHGIFTVRHLIVAGAWADAAATSSAAAVTSFLSMVPPPGKFAWRLETVSE